MSEFDRFRGSSKAFLVLTLLVFMLYKFIIVLRLIKTQGDKEVFFILFILLAPCHNASFL